MKLNAEFYVQAAIAMLVISFPPDPVKILFFNRATEDRPDHRKAAAAKVAFAVLVILGVSAIVGRELLELIGINLGAFGAVGGLIIAAMGFEMLYGGGASRAQGNKERDAGPDKSDGLIIPLAIPLIGGPGSITTVIAISSTNDSWDAVFAALIGVGAVVVVAYISLAWLGGLIGRLKPQAVSILARLGGLLLATIGAQMLFGGIRKFYGF